MLDVAPEVAATEARLMPRQLDLQLDADAFLPTEDEEAVGEHGEVFTRRWVVELILDLVGSRPTETSQPGGRWSLPADVARFYCRWSSDSCGRPRFTAETWPMQMERSWRSICFAET